MSGKKELQPLYGKAGGNMREKNSLILTLCWVRFFKESRFGTHENRQERYCDKIDVFLPTWVVSLQTEGSREISLKIFGYCDAEARLIVEHIRNNRQSFCLDFGGEYTIVYEDTGVTEIITSMIGAIQYFYFYDGNRFAHGKSILDIIKRLNLNWVWDWESVGDLCEQENLCENRTLHQWIKKVPAGSILTFTDKLIIRTTNLLDSIKQTNADPLDAITIFNTETARWAGKNPIISLSGGFDSRVILSSLLGQGIYPKVVTVGKESNSDMQVAQMIVNEFCLQHTTVELSLDALLNSGEEIAKITNGSKPACHWHTYLYPKTAGLPNDQTFFVGTLGEFARSYYFDKGFFALLNEGCPGFSQERFWNWKLLRHRTFMDSENIYLSDKFKNQVDQAGIRKRAQRNANLSKGGFLAGGARYYLEQRVPYFYANGISMYNATALWRSPFHNTNWLKVIWSLGDQWKLGSNWHRLAIKRNFPRLLTFPEEKGFFKNRMTSRATPLYWLPAMQRLKYQSYDLSSEWYNDLRVKEFILDNSRQIDDVVEKSLCEQIINEHSVLSNRTRAISFMLTLIFFKIALNRGRV
jgi:asparagine synthase (glutamine-hydrolysing)